MGNGVVGKSFPEGTADTTVLRQGSAQGRKRALMGQAEKVGRSPGDGDGEKPGAVPGFSFTDPKKQLLHRDGKG